MTPDGNYRDKVDKHIAESLAERQGALHLAADWGDYQKRVGYIQALRDVQGLCQIAARETLGI